MGIHYLIFKKEYLNLKKKSSVPKMQSSDIMNELRKRYDERAKLKVEERKLKHLIDAVKSQLDGLENERQLIRSMQEAKNNNESMQVSDAGNHFDPSEGAFETKNE